MRAAGAGADALAAQLILPSALKAMSGAATGRRPQLRPRILVTADMDDEGLATLRGFGDVEYASFRTVMRLLTGPTLVEALAGVQVFITEVDVVDADAVRQLPDLRAIAACRGDAVNVDVGAEIGIEEHDVGADQRCREHSLNKAVSVAAQDPHCLPRSNAMAVKLMSKGFGP